MDLNNEADNSSNQSLKIMPVISFPEFGLCCKFGACVGLACFLGSAVPGSCMAWSVQTLLESLRHMVKGSLTDWTAEGHTHQFRDIGSWIVMGLICPQPPDPSLRFLTQSQTPIKGGEIRYLLYRGRHGLYIRLDSHVLLLQIVN